MLAGASVFSGSQMTVEGPSQAETAPTTASWKGFPSTFTEQEGMETPFSIRQSPFAGCDAEASRRKYSGPAAGDGPEVAEGQGERTYAL